MGFFKKASDYYIEGIMYYKEKEYAKAYKCFEKGAEDDFEGCIEFLAYSKKFLRLLHLQLKKNLSVL